MSTCPWLKTPRSVAIVNADIGQRDIDDRRRRRHLRLLVEVVAAPTRIDSLACMAYADPHLRRPGAEDEGRRRSPTSTASWSASSTTCSTTLYESDHGLALAAPQIGVQKQVFVWDLDDEPQAIFNPEIVGVRRRVGLRRGLPVDPRPVRRDGATRRRCCCAASTSTATWSSVEADELEARMFQHELDHLNGVLMFDRMTPEQRKEAMAEYRRLQREAEPAAARRSAGAACACACG